MSAPGFARTRLLLVDDHALFREALVRTLEAEADFEVVGQCGTVEDAIRILGSTAADIVLLDLDLGSEHGQEFLTAARGMGFQGHVLVVTAGLSRREAARLQSGGSAGVFLKQDPPEHLVQRIRGLARGEPPLDRSGWRAIVDRLPTSLPTAFTSRERAVLRLAVEGHTNKEIASRIGGTETGIKAILQHLFEKTGVRTRAELVRVALERYSSELE